MSLEWLPVMGFQFPDKDVFPSLTRRNYEYVLSLSLLPDRSLSLPKRTNPSDRHINLTISDS